MNILITGAGGQLGNEVRNASTSSPHNYIFTDVAELDITCAEAVMKLATQEKIDVIVNCAAYTNVDKAEDDVAMAEMLNCTAAQNLAQAAKALNATLIHVSTDYVFDGNHCTPYQPTDTTCPTSVYGRTKLAGEDAIKATGCQHIILRTAWLYSPYGKNFVKTMRTLTRDKDSLKVVVDQVGSPTSAADLAELIVHIINKGMLNHQGLYHFSNLGVCSWYDFTIAIRDLSGNTCDVQPCLSHEFPSKVKRPNYSVLDKTLTATTFNFRIPYWRDSLSACISRIESGVGQ